MKPRFQFSYHEGFHAFVDERATRVAEHLFAEAEKDPDLDEKEKLMAVLMNMYTNGFRDGEESTLHLIDDAMIEVAERLILSESEIEDEKPN